MKSFRSLFLISLAAVVFIGGGAFVGQGNAFAQSTSSSPKLTKEERRAAREKRISEKATAATQVKVREGKHPSYNRLIKSTSYALMYTEGLRYYNMTRKGKTTNTMANMRRAQSLFESAVKSQVFNGSPQDDSLYYYYGCSYFQAKDFQTSQEIFDQFRRRYSVSKFIEDAEYRFATGFYYLSPDSKHDQSITVRAISQITEFLGRYPGTTHREICDERIVELRRKLYTKSFENAKLYYTIGQYKAAVRALGNAIDEYPASPYREELMYLATRSAYLYAKNSVPGQMTDRYMSMMDNYYNLISEYPETRYLREVEQMRDEARSHIEKHTSENTENTTTADNGN
jgi:outer membrane protein assembly factor BamD